jgi:molecular chaperone GrpE
MPENDNHEPETTQSDQTPNQSSREKPAQPTVSARLDPSDAAPQGSAETDADNADGQDDVGAVDPAAAVAILESEIDELKDQLLRARAEIENQRKRHERERLDISKYAVSKFATDILQVGDNFQRAMDAVPEGAAEADPALKSFLEGVNMAERDFLNTLDRHGVKRMIPTGEPFDPHFHQAMIEQEHQTAAPGTVLHVVQAGYVLHERVLRPAMVVVAKAPSGGGTEDEPSEPGGPPAA